MFKLMDKKIIAILRKLLLLNWSYDTVQSLYSRPSYNTDLDKMQSCCGSQFILPWNFTIVYGKMTLKWLFFYNSFVKFSLSYDVASGNEIKPCKIIDKPLVV